MKSKTNPAGRHHYVPEFYQKGFCNDSEELYAYKKTYGGIKKWTPAQILYEMNLHTLNLNGEKELIIESFYSLIEDGFSKYISVIREIHEDNEILFRLSKDEHFVKILKLLISLQFWRTPCKKELAVQYAPKLLGFYDKASDEIKEVLKHDRKFVKFISKRARKDDSIKIIQFLMLPLLSFNISNEIGSVKLFKAPKGKYFFSSDRPVVFNDQNELFSFQSFIFPFSRELLVIGEGYEVSKSINTINEVITDGALEVVICGSKEQLNEMKNNINKKIS